MSIDSKVMRNIGYGLYAVTCKEGAKDNGLIVNTLVQVTSDPLKVSVCINKSNYSHDMIKNTGVMNIACIAQSAPFELFKALGFSSGRDTDKLASLKYFRSENGVAVLSENINSFMSLKVWQYIDLGSHGMFICDVTESAVINKEETMSYSYYHANVKPKPEAKKSEKKTYVCRICGYVHEGDSLPEDFVCPWCKHGPEDFEER